MKGKVWLVGAGPGDAGLLTLKGEQVLKRAEVVVYDALVGQGILAMLPPKAQRVYVGKKIGNHTIVQEKINEILLEQALLGKRVVRLKGGDPFLFGRGGEELELLYQNKIPFEVVPGVTSALSVPAYAGIPVTQRGYASELHIITAHRKCGEKETIDFKSLVALKNATLVFMMGVGQVEHICTGLIEAGLAKDTPAAILEKGTTAAQRRIVSTVLDLPKRAKEASIGYPGIILVGRVCTLAHSLHWAEDRVLGKTRVIVTRPRGKTSKITQKLQELGAEVLCVPTIQTKPISILEHLDALDQMDWILFTSDASVEVFFKTLQQNKTDIRCLPKVKFAAVGKATADAVQSHGVLVEYVPDTFCGQALGAGLPFEQQENILLFLPKDTPSDCEDELKKRGARLHVVPAYETFLEPVAPFVLQKNDLAVFTSASTVQGFVAAMGTAENVKAVCIGKKTQEEALRHGMETFVSKEASLDSLVEELVCVAEKMREE